MIGPATIKRTPASRRASRPHRHPAPRILVDLSEVVGTRHRCRGHVVMEFRAAHDRQPYRSQPDTTKDDGRAPIRLEAGHACVVSVEQPTEFLGDHREDLGRVDSAGDQRGHPAQLGMLGQQPGQLVPAGLQCSPVLRVRDRGGDQVGELAHPLLADRRQRSVYRYDADHPTQPPVDLDRHDDSGAQHLTQEALAARDVTVVMNSRRPTGPPDDRSQPGRRIPLERSDYTLGIDRP